MVKRILFFLDSLPIGGAERHAIHLANALNQRGFDAGLLVYSGIRSPNYSDSDLPPFTQLLGRGSNNTDVRGWRMAAEEIKRAAPDVLVAVNQATLAVAVLTKLLGWHSASIVCLFHTTVIATRRGKIRLPAFFALLRFADSIVYVSQNQKRYWERRGLKAGASLAIVNGVDTTFYSPPSELERIAARTELGISNDEFVVGLTAQFRPEKNQGQLVDAAAELSSRGARIRVLFVGDGPCRDSVQGRVRELGLNAQVIFAGEQKDVRPFLRAMDAAVLTSKSIETLSLAALEAIASGVPVVLSDIGGASEIVEEGINGFLFPPGDTAKLVQQLSRIAFAPDGNRLRKNARDVAVERFDYKNMLNSYVKFFDEFCPKSGSDRTLPFIPGREAA